MAKVKISKHDIGRWVTVKWDDIGRIDCLLVDVEEHGVTVFQPYEGTSKIDRSDIIEKRGYQNAA